MIVYRIENANSDKCWHKGDVLQSMGIDMDKLSKGRRMAEEKLEEDRKKRFPLLAGRLDSIFVFPNDKIEERAFHWAQKFVPHPNDACLIYLLELECDEVQWHNATFFEDLCHLCMSQRYMMKNRDSSEDELLEKYWSQVNDCNITEIEGLVKTAKVISLSSYCVTHQKIIAVEKDM